VVKARIALFTRFYPVGKWTVQVPPAIRLVFPSYWTVFISTRTPWMVRPEALKTRPAGCGAMFTTKHP
jgi:hypothetical protein